MAPSHRRRPHQPRLLLLTPDFPPAAGGIQLMAQRLAEEINGFRTRVVALATPGGAEFDREHGLSVRRVGGGSLPRGLRNALLNGVALLEALRFRPQLTLSLHIVASPAAAAIRRALGARTVQYFHAEEIGAKPKLAAFAARQADVCVVVSAYTGELLRTAAGEGIDLRLIPPGVDLPAYEMDVPDDSAPGDERPTVLTVARLQERYKGHDVLVRALALVRARVPDVQWVVIGEGALRAGLEELASAYGVADCTRFLGAVSDHTRNQELRRAHLLAMPSRLPGGGYAGEGFGIAYLEAGAYGKPVVAGRAGGALDAVAEGESGLLVDPTDPLAVADAIADLLLDPERAQRLGAGGAHRALNFSWPLVASRVEALLREQLPTPSAGAESGPRPRDSTTTAA